LAVSLSWESGVHLSTIATTLDLLLSVVTVGRLTNRCLAHPLILFRVVIIERGKVPCKMLKVCRKTVIMGIKFRNKGRNPSRKRFTMGAAVS
jgi:hypothetical protein